MEKTPSEIKSFGYGLEQLVVIIGGIARENEKQSYIKTRLELNYSAQG